MNSVELTTSEFRQNQKRFLDMAAAGISVFIHRGKEIFLLNKVRTEQLLDEETHKQIELAREEYATGDTITTNNKKELDQFLSSL